MNPLSQRRHARAAFTFAELMVAVSVTMVVGLVLVTFSNTSLTLFAKNFSLNESHQRARDVVERTNWLIHQAVQAPLLVDANGAAVGGDGPAAGVTVMHYAAIAPYYTTSAIVPASTSFTIGAITAGQVPPRVDDIVVMMYQDTTGNNSGTLQATVSAVSGGSSSTTVTISTSAVNSFSPYNANSWTIPIGQGFFLLRSSSLVAVPNGTYSELRYYWYTLTVASDGATAFGNAANYQILGQLLPRTGATAAFPFSFSDYTHRLVSIDARAISTRYLGRGYAEDSHFQLLHSSVAYRSAIQKGLQP